MSSSVMTVIVYNGLCNRLLPITSSLRLLRNNKIKEKYKINVIWTHTPVRTCLTYYGEFCAFNDLYKVSEIKELEVNQEYSNYNHSYEFQYWLSKDHIINTANTSGNIFVNYALYPLLSHEDGSSPFVNTKKLISSPCEIKFDYVAEEIAAVMKSLKPRDELQTEITNFQKTFKKNMIGLHLRKSDGGFQNNNWNEITQILIQKCKNWCSMDMENNGIYLATDDQDIYVEFLIKLGKSLCSYDPPNVLCSCSSKFDNKFSNDKYNVLVAVVELHSFSKCNKMIIGTVDSTFSLCAMLLSEENPVKYLINGVDNIPDF